MSNEEQGYMAVFKKRNNDCLYGRRLSVQKAAWDNLERSNIMTDTRGGSDRDLPVRGGGCQPVFAQG